MITEYHGFEEILNPSSKFHEQPIETKKKSIQLIISSINGDIKYSELLKQTFEKLLDSYKD